MMTFVQISVTHISPQSLTWNCKNERLILHSRKNRQFMVTFIIYVIFRQKIVLTEYFTILCVERAEVSENIFNFAKKITCLSKYLIKSLYFTKISTLFSLFHTFQIKLFLFFLANLQNWEVKRARCFEPMTSTLSAFFHYPTW